MRTTLPAAILLLLTAACVETRQHLPGYEQIRFGMTDSELQAVAPSVADRSAESGRWMTAYKPVSIGDMEFTQRILLDAGAVRRVSLIGVFAAGSAGCEPDFNRLVQHFAARHGPPDHRTDRSQDQDIHEAEFRFADSSQIAISTQRVSSQPNGHDDACAVSVVHSAAGWAL